MTIKPLKTNFRKVEKGMADNEIKINKVKTRYLRINSSKNNNNQGKRNENTSWKVYIFGKYANGGVEVKSGY